jgi:hypothetical protein
MLLQRQSRQKRPEMRAYAAVECAHAAAECAHAAVGRATGVVATVAAAHAAAPSSVWLYTYGVIRSDDDSAAGYLEEMSRWTRVLLFCKLLLV